MAALAAASGSAADPNQGSDPETLRQPSFVNITGSSAEDAGKGNGEMQVDTPTL